VPVLFAGYLKVMFDLQILAMQTDMTRGITFMYGREASHRTYGEIGISDPHRPLTHHQGKKDWIEKITQINTYHIKNFAYFLNRLKTAAFPKTTRTARSVCQSCWLGAPAANAIRDATSPIPTARRAPICT
jgi:hypothetical protein